MLEKMQVFSAEKNVAGLQKVVQNLTKNRSSIIKDVNMR